MKTIFFKDIFVYLLFDFNEMSQEKANYKWSSQAIFPISKLKLFKLHAHLRKKWMFLAILKFPSYWYNKLTKF